MRPRCPLAASSTSSLPGFDTAPRPACTASCASQLPVTSSVSTMPKVASEPGRSFDHVRDCDIVKGEHANTASRDAPDVDPLPFTRAARVARYAWLTVHAILGVSKNVPWEVLCMWLGRGCVDASRWTTRAAGGRRRRDVSSLWRVKSRAILTRRRSDAGSGCFQSHLRIPPSQETYRRHPYI